MNQLLKIGDTVRAHLQAIPCVVDAFLGAGGQGEVYRARLGGNTVALKWYFKEQATSTQRRVLDDLVRRGAPAPQFLWPTDLATSEGVPGFGYVMPLRGQRFRGLMDLVARRVQPTFHTLITAAIQLAASYKELHSKGLCYRDISFGNVFFDPATGDILICDNDNVDVDGSTSGGVLGTPDFMAPELVRGEGRPSRVTDCHSLAVLFFYMFINHHPLYGRRLLSIRCLDLPARTKLCGTEPLFIFDPQDRSNEAVPLEEDPERIGDAGANAVKIWPLFPSFFQDLFLEAFTAGLREPNRRLGETIWQKTLVRLRDAIVRCGCGAENFFDKEGATRATSTCWHCKQALHHPLCLSFGKSIVVLNDSTSLYPHHVDPQRDFDFSAPVATVARHPTNPQLWGLKNTSAAPWSITMADGTARTVEPGRSVSLALGTRIQFGNAEGEIVQ